MAIQFINTGTSSNAGNGDSIRSAFTKVNQNFDFLSSIVLGTGTDFTGSVQDIVEPMLVHTAHRGISAQYNSFNDQIILSLDAGVFDNIAVLNTASLRDAVITGTTFVSALRGTDDISVTKFANTGTLNLRLRNTFGPGNSSMSLVDNTTGSFVILHQNSGGSTSVFSAGQNYIYDSQGRSINIGRSGNINFYADAGWLSYTNTPSVAISNTGTVTINSALNLAQDQIVVNGKLVEFNSNSILINGAEITGAGSYLISGDFTATLTTSGSFVLPGNTVLEYNPYVPPGHTVTNYGASYSTDAPFSGVGSIFFDGNSRIEVAGGSHFDLTTGTYTVEWFQKPTEFNTASIDTIFILGQLNAQTLQANNAYLGTGTATSIVLEGAYQQSVFYNTNFLNTWTHVAVVKTPTSFSVFIDGVQTANIEPELWPTPIVSNADLVIGAAKEFVSTYANYFTGFISNMRWEAREVYTGNFTPPTTILTATSDTRLLLATENSNNYLLDASGLVEETRPALTIAVSSSTLKISDQGDLVLKYGNTATLTIDGDDRSSTFAGHILPAQNLTYDLGSNTAQWRSLWVGTSTIYIDQVPVTVNKLTNALIVGTTTNFTTATTLATESFVIDYVAQNGGGGGGIGLEIDGGDAFTIYTAEIEIDGGGA